MVLEGKVTEVDFQVLIKTKLKQIYSWDVFDDQLTVSGGTLTKLATKNFLV